MAQTEVHALVTDRQIGEYRLENKVLKVYTIVAKLKPTSIKKSNNIKGLLPGKCFRTDMELSIEHNF